MFKRAFTMVELIFVITIMGILGKFGVGFLMNAYETFFFTSLQNRLQQHSEAAVTQLASRLQYRIKNTVAMSTGGTQIDWVGSHIEGWRSPSPTWSGFINLDINTVPNANILNSPETNTSAVNSLIDALSDGDSAINDAAIVFIGATDPTSTVWDGNAVSQINELAHPIQASGNNFASNTGGSFSGVDVYEFYQLSWSAYTVRLVGTDLILYYDYQPWQGESWNHANAKNSILMANVDSFQYQTIGDLIKIQVCVNDQNLAGGFSVCKEKTIF